VQTFITLHEQHLALTRQVEELARVSERLTESLRLHETFVAALNHDLRSPLHTIMLGVAMLAEAAEPKQQDTLRRLGTAAQRMGGMLDDLYDLARVRLGEGLVLERSHGDLGRVIGEAVKEAELRTTGRRVAIDLRGDATGDWDLPRISRVAVNLIGNALAHGAKHGAVEVAVDGSRPDEVTLAVTNAGVIPSELIPNIFEPFRRGERAGSGLGLGLYIVREITSAHGGEVSVTSTPIAGTRFEVRLPRHHHAAP
jgi:signal transduction histidine kinase